MGANTFNIRNKSSNIRIGKKGTKKPKRYASISYDEAIRFKNEFSLLHLYLRGQALQLLLHINPKKATLILTLLEQMKTI